MPYFSFIIYKKINEKNINYLSKFKIKTKYFSKNTKLWSKLNKIKDKTNLIALTKEKRKSFIKNFNSILFCLPPNIGLGDSIEYGLAIKAIKLNYINIRIGIAHVGPYKDIFINQFDIINVYDSITEQQLKSYDTTFHFTLEIESLFFQKYNRQNIEKKITDFFKVPIYRNKFSILKNFINKKTISIFPVSQSPIRSIPLFILNDIIKNYIENFNIEIYLNNNSEISDYILNKINFSDKIKFCNPKNLNQLISSISKIHFGIFADSGPLHVAKIFNKSGVLIVSTVNEEILLNRFPSIKAIQSKYVSDFCKGPCGLINAFEFNNKFGCYDDLKIMKEDIMKMKSLKSLQRGGLKENYLNLYIKSVNCYKKFNTKQINKLIDNIIKVS